MWNYKTQVVNSERRECEESRLVVLAYSENLLVLHA